MLKMPHESEYPSNKAEQNTTVQNSFDKHSSVNIFSWIKSLIKNKPESTLRKTIEEYIEKPKSFEETPTISTQERAILSNILDLRDINVLDVMVPRADIVAIDVSITNNELFSLLAEKQFSRIPVYHETLDEVLGTVHIKDIMASIAKGLDINIKNLITELPVVSPSMSLLDLVLKMRQSRRHMVMVIDEYGGIDGLVTIGDIIESIIGEIDDEHDTNSNPEMLKESDGSITADGRVNIEEFEERFGTLLSKEEREESDTLGGLVSDIAGHMPTRGEILTHKTGMIFEVIDADPRRINKLRITNIPKG